VKKYTRERENSMENVAGMKRKTTPFSLCVASKLLSYPFYSFYCRKVGEGRGKEEVRNDKKKKREKGKDEKRKKWNG